ncbi:hypothetical protein HMPREF9071_1863 [Capnocytophaga sp. oral taxon 338 str. F0234]|jgi:Ferredoxin subunits of nitrite reductase and ring-hydroxylating dioxygenases|nr:hypothetical protein HMPREF9071_1863 [Capnocytophaga sp. oral taxon 338 str. F0234]
MNMKNKYFCMVALFLLLFIACKKNDIQRNPFLQEAKFSRTINLRLVEYNKLKIPGNAVLIDNIGLRGVVVANVGNSYYAWDRACPSQALSECSQMTLEDNNYFMYCPCNGVRYSLLNGQPQTGNSPYPMLNYQVVTNGDFLTISN